MKKGPRPDAASEDAAGFVWSNRPPEKRSTLLAIDGLPIRVYPDYIQALRRIRNRDGFVEVRWLDPEGVPRVGAVEVARRPTRTYLSVVWFLQEILIFAVGGWIYWRRPHDEAAPGRCGIAQVVRAHGS